MTTARSTLAWLTLVALAGAGCRESQQAVPLLVAAQQTEDCPADLNADRVVNSLDARALRSALGCPSDCDPAADLDDDGDVDGDDVTAFLAIYTPGPCPGSARELFFRREFVAADDVLQSDLARNPSDPLAHFLRAITRLVRLLEDGLDVPSEGFVNELQDILDRFGFAGGERRALSFTAELPRDALGRVDLPEGSPTGGELQDYLEDFLLPELRGAIENLRALDPSFRILVRSAELASLGWPGLSPVEIDFGDAKLLEAQLAALEAEILVSLAYGLDVDIDALTQPDETPRLQQDVIDPDPDVLALRSGGAELLAEADDAARRAIEAYQTASLAIRTETDPQGDDLLTLRPENLADEALIRARLAELRAALDGPASVAGIWVDLTRLFDDAFDLRAAAPEIAFDPARSPSNFLEPGAFPDPTFEGVLPEFTQARLTELFGLGDGLAASFCDPPFRNDDSFLFFQFPGSPTVRLSELCPIVLGGTDFAELLVVQLFGTGALELVELNADPGDGPPQTRPLFCNALPGPDCLTDYVSPEQLKVVLGCPEDRDCNVGGLGPIDRESILEGVRPGARGVLHPDYDPLVDGCVGPRESLEARFGTPLPQVSPACDGSTLLVVPGTPLPLEVFESEMAALLHNLEALEAAPAPFFSP